MKKAIFLLTAAILVLCCANCAYAAQEPYLKSISFKNAQIEGEFSSDKYSYDLSLDNADESPELESYEIEGSADIFVNYVTNESGKETATEVTLEYGEKSVVYTFNHKIEESIETNGNCSLASISCEYCELSPAFSSAETEYTLYIPKDLTKLTVKAKTDDENASVPTLDITMNKNQEASIPLVCTASNGEKKTYTLNIKRGKKTLAEVKAQLKNTGKISLTEEENTLLKTENIVIFISCAAGIVVIFLLYKFIRRKLLRPYDSDEKPFYKE